MILLDFTLLYFQKESDMETSMNVVGYHIYLRLFDFGALIKALKRGSAYFIKRRLIYIRF